MTDAFIVDYVRTPIGRFGGALSSVRPDDLAAHAIAALVGCHPALALDSIDEVILGCANQAGEDNRNVARMAALLAGLPVTVAGSTVNRLCGSGMDAVATATRPRDDVHRGRPGDSHRARGRLMAEERGAVPAEPTSNGAMRKDQ